MWGTQRVPLGPSCPVYGQETPLASELDLFSCLPWIPSSTPNPKHSLCLLKSRLPVALGVKFIPGLASLVFLSTLLFPCPCLSWPQCPPSSHKKHGPCPMASASLPPSSPFPSPGVTCLQPLWATASLSVVLPVQMPQGGWRLCHILSLPSKSPGWAVPRAEPIHQVFCSRTLHLEWSGASVEEMGGLCLFIYFLHNPQGLG